MIKKYFLAGILIWVPVVITVLVIEFLLQIFDRIVALIPKAYQPETLFGVHLPGFSLIVIVMIIFLTGMLASNVIGSFLVLVGEKIVARIPLIRSIYAGAKQILQTLFVSGNAAFRKVVLIEYPRRGLWTWAFQTSNGVKEVNDRVGEDLITVYVPTTPNPTSGFLLSIPSKDVIELEISVDAALKLIISLGVIAPLHPRSS